MESRFFYDLQQKQLCFDVREKVLADPHIKFKCKGLFNTTSANCDYRAQVKKFVPITLGGTGSKLAGPTPLWIGAGAALESSTSSKTKPSPVLTASAKKTTPLLDGPDTTVTLKGRLDFDPRTSTMVRTGAVQLTHTVMNLTQKQDLRVRVGLEVDWPSGVAKPGKPSVYVQLRENNWALNYRRKRLFVTYDL